MSAPLSKGQKSYLSQLARRAWAKTIADADGVGPEESQFRHDQVALACGKLGLRCCSQDDYKIVEAHFLNLLGETGRAMNALVRSQDNPRRIARYKLDQALREAQLETGYAEKICRAQFKCGVNEATEKQLWCLMFTVKNRGRKVTFSREAVAA